MFGDCAHLLIVKYQMQCFILSHLVFFTEHCISDVGYTDDGEECSTSCGVEHGDSSEWLEFRKNEQVAY